ncbi:MAG: c-type cytochrome domain-containing protein [Clostridiales bacterium]
MKYNILLALSFLSFITYVGCKDTVTAEDVSKRTIPSSNVSYNKDLQPVLDLYCNTSKCHDDNSRAGGLSFTSYQNTTSDPTVVVKGYPDNSRLIWVIQPGASNPMPPINYPPLNQNQIAGFTTWIKEGAKPN